MVPLDLGNNAVIDPADDLAGMTGSMSINITDGKHFYELDYSIG